MSTCETDVRAFAAHGIEDGSDLISRTARALAAMGHREPEPSDEFTESVARAFRQAYARTATVPIVPDPVDAAIDEATDTLAHRVLDDPDADLRTEVLPSFYRSVTNTYCAHLDAGGDPGSVGIWFER